MTSETSDESGFSIVMCSDIDYEFLFASIEYDGQAIAIVQQEEGRTSFKLEAWMGDTAKPGMAWVVDLDGFLEAVQVAKRRLLERQSEERASPR